MSWSCQRYSALVRLIRNSRLTTFCVNNQNHVQSDRQIYIHCVECEWYVKCYSGEELTFFVKFNEPGITPYLCVPCCSIVYKSIEIDRFYSERASTLLNRTDYWGVIDSKSAQRIKDSFKYANKCGSFVWEVQETFSFEKRDRVLLIAVTHVRYSTSTYRPVESSDLDECTYYIARSDGGYILMVRVEGSIIFESSGSTWFRSLSEAIFRAKSDRVSLTPQCVSRCTVRQPPPLEFHLPCRCVCTDISRLSLVQKSSNPPQIRPFMWTLQDLTTFFIRNHSFHFQKEIVRSRELPTSLKNRIRDVRVLDICFR
jgi:hypothetical protein